MSNYKLTYFNSRGRAELIRILFAVADVKYVDERLEHDQWPARKPDTPFAQLPMLEVDGVKLCQSNACARFVARKYNLAGKTDLEQAQADMLVDCLEDSVKPLIGFFGEKDEAVKAAIKKKYLEEQLPGYLTLLEGLLKSNHGGDKFLVGDGLTWADVAALSYFSWMLMMGAEELLAKHPKLLALKERVEKQPKVAAWIEKRPVTER